MPVIGIDASLTSTGFSYIDAQGELHTGRIKPGTLRGVERLQFIALSVEDVLNKVSEEHGAPVGLVAIEDYAMGKGGKGSPGRAFSIGEGGGVIRLTVHRKGVDLMLVSPGSLKKFLTGKGNTEKKLIPSFIASEWGYNVKQNDEADAYVLLRMAQAQESTRPPRQQYRRDALNACSIYKGMQCS